MPATHRTRAQAPRSQPPQGLAAPALLFLALLELCLHSGGCPTLPSKALSAAPSLPCHAAPLTFHVFIAFPWHWVTWAHIPSTCFLDQVANRSLPDTHSANVSTKACLAQPSRLHPGGCRGGNVSTWGHHLGFLLGGVERRCGQTAPAYTSCPHLSWRAGCPLLAEEARESSLPGELVQAVLHLLAPYQGCRHNVRETRTRGHTDGQPLSWTTPGFSVRDWLPL